MKNKQLTKYEPDSMKHLERTDLIQLSRDLLEAVISSTKIMDGKEATPQHLKEANTVLGFLNASINATKAKMNFFRMIGLDQKIKAVRKSGKMLR